MNLGPQKISTTYPYVINKSGSAFTLGDGGTVNWADAEIVVTSGTVAQQIGGLKTFTSNLTIPSTLNFTSQGSFVKAGNHAVTLNTSAAPTITFASTNARTYTIPDPGANTSFVMGRGDQNIAGNLKLSNINISGWGASDTDIDGLVNGSTFGSLLESPTYGHFTIGLVSNDTSDGFQILSKGTGFNNYIANCFEVKSNGQTTFGTGSNKVYITESGRLGVGVNSPIGALDVAGSITLNQNNNRLNFKDNLGTFPAFAMQSDNNFVFYGTDILGGQREICSISQRNNTSPFKINAPVEIYNNLDMKGGDINLNGPNKKLILYSGGLTNNAYIQAESNGEVSVYNGTLGVSKKLTVTSAGAVGVGTGTPSNSLLHIYGNDFTKGLKIENSNPAQYNGANLYLKNASGNFRSTSIIHGNNSADGKQSVFSINGNNSSDTYVQTLAAYYYDPIHAWSIKTSGQDAVIINHLGDVGIGTNSPTQKLDVHGSIKASGLQLNRGQLLRWGNNNENNDDSNITVIGSTVDATEMRFRIGDGNDPNDKFVFQQGNAAGGSSNTPMMTIQANGNVGIGTGIPEYKLDVIDGKVRILNRIGDAAIEVGEGVNANRYAYIDLIGDTNYRDYGLRVLRGNTGPDTFSNIFHRGTGVLTIGTQDGGDMMLITSGQERLTINKNGNTTINGNLIVNGSISASNNINLQNAQASLASDVRLTGVNVWIDGPVLSNLSAGKWLVNAHASFSPSGTTITSATYSARISDGTNHYASSSSYPVINTVNSYASITLTSIITLNSTTTIKLQGVSNLLTTNLMKATAFNTAGNNATQITAVRIG